MSLSTFQYFIFLTMISRTSKKWQHDVYKHWDYLEVMKSCMKVYAQLTFRGRIGTLSLSEFIPGMTTVIFRGPLKPNTIVS